MFSKLSAFCLGIYKKALNTSSLFRCLRGQHNTVPRVTCCLRAAGWVDLFFTDVYVQGYCL